MNTRQRGYNLFVAMKNAFAIFLTFAFLGIFLIGSVSAQEKSRVECPKARVTTSSDFVTESETITFRVELVGGNVDRNALEFESDTDAGRIASGQGTPVIIVRTAGDGSHGSITAKVDINAYRECSQTKYASVYVRRKGTRTNADLFWEFLWIAGAKAQFVDVSDISDIEKEIRVRLDQIDPSLTVELGPKDEDGKREIIVGHNGKPYDSKAVSEFVARAPKSIIADVVFKKTSIFHPQDGNQ
jgi:hypothetical protein